MKTKKTILLIILIFVVTTIFGQSEKIVRSKKLIHKDSKWYLKQGDDEFLLNNIITVFVGNRDLTNFKDDLRQINGTIIRINKLGYADIEISEEALFSKLHSMSLMKKYSYDLNTYGRYTINPNDNFYLNSQFSYLSQVQLPPAWNFTLGSNCVTVAIIDSGIDWLHEDLGFGTDTYSNIWFNNGEDDWGSNPNGGDGLDNDNNGYIDDYLGWDFSNGNNDSRGSNFHGTHVAGIVSAKTNNSEGVAGVSGGNDSQGTLLMPIKVGDAVPDGAVLDDAIIYAVDNGAKVIQLSLTVSQSNSIDAAIDYARQNNVSVVCATGNNNSSISYPASNSKVLAVGSVDSNNQKSSFSNFGSELDVVAPGENIYSTQLSNSYGASSGTSFATPIVSGVIALMLNMNFNLTPLELEQILKSTALDINTSGFDNFTGYGLIDAHAAVQAALPNITGPSEVCPTNSTFNLNSPPPGATVGWSASSNLNISTSNNNSVTVQSSSSTIRGDGWIRATINNDCGSVEIEKEVWVERFPADPSLMQGSTNVVPNAWEYYSVPAQEEASSYTWNIPSGWSFHHTSSTTSNQVLLVTGSSSGFVAVRANNECNNPSNYRSKYVTVSGNDCGSPVCYFTYSPNPVEETLTVEMEPTTYDLLSNDTYKISLNNQYGKVVYEAESNNICHDIDMKKMPKGIYRIVVSHKDKQQIAKILKQ